jgi:hypothetical protein
MTTPTATTTSREWDKALTALLDDAAFQRIVEHLDTTAPATAHPLVTKTTAQLVDEALRATPRPGPTADEPAVRSPLRGIWRALPDKMLGLRRPRGPVDHRTVTVAEFLELTAAVLQHSGWARTGHQRIRTPLGRRCIAGAQAAVYALGYGCEMTLDASCHLLDTVLRERGAYPTYYRWNEQATAEQVLELINAARQRALTEGK